MIKFSIWLIRVIWSLKKDDRSSLRAAIRRWTDWKQDWDEIGKTGKVNVKNIHDGILGYLPMGAGYVLLVSQSQSNNWKQVDVEITFSSNLSIRESVKILQICQRTLEKSKED